LRPADPTLESGKSRLLYNTFRSSTWHPANESFFYLAGLNQTDMDFQFITGRPDKTDPLVFTTTFTHNNVFYKAALAETISWEGHHTGTYDVLLQSGKGTQRLTLIKDGEHWRAGEEIEQIGIIHQEVVDLLGAVINEVRR
jgi:hypothetical protein